MNDNLKVLADKMELAAQGINDAFVVSRWTDAQRIADNLREYAAELRSIPKACNTGSLEKQAVTRETKVDHTIWKFPVPVQDSFDISMSPDAEVLSVQVQHGTPYLWVRTPAEAIKPDYLTWSRRFYLHGTGHTVNKGAGRFIGTFQMHGGSLVFHLFESKP